MQRRSKTRAGSERSAMKSMGVKRISRKWLLIVPVALVVSFATFVAFRFVGQDLTLAPRLDFEFPEFQSAEKLMGLSESPYAVAVNGQIVASSSDEVRPTASTAKMILALAVMQEKGFSATSVGETLTLGEADVERYQWYVANNGSNVPVEAGEEISEYDALAAVMLASANNMADSLASWAFGSQDKYREFATKMLAEHGIEHTTIGVDASGYDSSTTSTTSDLARIGWLVMSDPVLSKIVATKSREIPVVGEIANTNHLLGVSDIAGVKTGYIGEESGYCLVSGYRVGDDIVTVALLGATSREESFEQSLSIVNAAHELLAGQKFVANGDAVGYYDTWWTGKTPIIAQSYANGISWTGDERRAEFVDDGKLKIVAGGREQKVEVYAPNLRTEPTFGERLAHVFGWRAESKFSAQDEVAEESPEESAEADSEAEVEVSAMDELAIMPITAAPSDNCTVRLGRLMLINPNFVVDADFIVERRGELVSMMDTYGIPEYHAWNGDNLLDPEAGAKLNEMLAAYAEENPGHYMETVSCFRSVGTSCGRLCAATGESDHHTGLTCDLIDPEYGGELDTDDYDNHAEWQWLYANSYKYGFIDRFPEAWAGGPMSEPANVNAEGSTGLYETWHYRYVGVAAATEIATGKYNNGEYDSLEHYLLSRGLVNDLVAGTCP